MIRTDLTGRSGPGLDELIQLNEEIAALVRAGVPLELGLRNLGDDLRGRLADIANRLAGRMEEGASLVEALQSEAAEVPPVYRAVVEAGLRAGRLPEALESLTGFGRTMLDIRQRLGLALIYPTIVLLLAYSIWLAFIAWMVPILIATRDQFRLPNQRWLDLLGGLHQTVVYWGPAVPVVAIVALLVLRLRGPSPAPMIDAQQSWLPPLAAVGWVPGVKAIVQNLHRSNFAEMLALLIEHEVPLQQAVPLAADATGDARFAQAGRRMAEGLREGSRLAAVLPRSPLFPPLVRWLLDTGEQQGALAAALRQVTEVYRRRALYYADLFKVLVPMALVVLVGGTATLVYGLSLFLPLTEILRGLVGQS